MEGSEVQEDGQSQDPGLDEAPTGAPPPETEDQPAGAPETEGEDVEPEGGGATDTEGTPDASGGSI
jgi:hypothetical protein